MPIILCYFNKKVAIKSTSLPANGQLRSLMGLVP